MPVEFVLRVSALGSSVDVPATLVAAGPEAARAFRGAVLSSDVTRVLLTGDRDYYAVIAPAAWALHGDALAAARGRYVRLVFARRSPVRRVLAELASPAARPPSAPPAVALDLTEGVSGRAPLWLLADGTFSTRADAAQQGFEARPALVAAARWISSRRGTTFERLFVPSAFAPDRAARLERVSEPQARAMLSQAREALRAAAPSGDEARRDPDGAAQLRSAALTVLSHITATALRDPAWRAVSSLAAAEIFALVAGEQGPAARPALRAHAVLLLQLRAPALEASDRPRALALVKSLAREAPPYDALPGAWNFAMCSAWDFHEGEVEVLARQHGFTAAPVPPDAPPSRYGAYTCLEAPFRTPTGHPVRILARSASPGDESAEMGSDWFAGVCINRHAQLGSFDMRASRAAVAQRGYKLMMNTQCAGLTTRFALSRMFPDADLYSSWDSTYFRTAQGGKVSASEGLDCFVAALQGMARRETHAQLDRRIKAAQWYHPQVESDPGFAQFVGPAHPLVVARYSDVNHDARGDFYDGFLDLDVRAIATEMADGITPRDPGVAASQVGGEAARSLGWAAGSMNRVTQYSDLWAALPGRSELFYAFEAAGYFSHLEPPHDVPTGLVREDLGRLPAVCRYIADPSARGGLRVEVMFHAWLAHAPEELKRLLVAAEAMNRAFDLKHLPAEGALSTPQARRGAVLLTLAGLLEFPADQNRLDGLWATALRMLNLPDISRSVVRACITDEDHDASNYYGSVRGLRALVGAGADRGALGRADALAWSRIAAADPAVGRAATLALG
jgi:hypothetical protein